MAKTLIRNVRNRYGVKVRKCCLSCAFKDYLADGTRICTKHDNEEVTGRDKCKLWVRSDGMKNAGRGGGVVRDRDTKEVVIH